MDFHRNLLNKRKLRISSQLEENNNNIKNKEEVCELLKSRINEIYASLDDSVDLVEITALANEITQLKIKFEKLTSYSNILKNQETKKLHIEQEISNQNIITQEYVESIDKNIELISSKFNEYVYSMYGDIDSYIRLSNNTQNGSLRYNMDVNIPNDSSDGIKDAKILCFDLMMKSFGNKYYDFLIHDNKIFYGFDYNMVSRILKKLYNDKFDYQYIITINQSDYDGIKKEMDDTDLFNKIVEDNIKIRLTSSNKLLGKNIDIKIQD